MTEPLVPRDDLQATIAARRELGSEHDAELIDAFVARIERRLDARPRTKHVATGSRTGGGVGLGIASMALAIPLIAIGGSFGGPFGVLAVCVLLVVINALYWEQTK